VVFLQQQKIWEHEMTTRDFYKGIYAISDGSSLPLLMNSVLQVLDGGVSIIQYRDKSDDKDKRYKEASILKKLCDQYNTPLIINDDIQLTKDISATGVHLGSNDESLLNARRILGSQAIIGVSCYNQLDLAIKAEQQGANYIAFGSMFASPTKPDAPHASIDLLIKAHQQLTIPICCIGGITEENVDQLVKAGADMVALISALFASDDPKRAAQIFSAHYDLNP
jgi:thiamine-phosphate pyrophosphorylase